MVTKKYLEPMRLSGSHRMLIREGPNTQKVIKAKNRQLAVVVGVLLLQSNLFRLYALRVILALRAISMQNML